MSETSTKPPTWFWILAVILLLWGMMGMYVYYDFVTSTPESMAEYVSTGAYSQVYADYLLAEPVWSTAVFAWAVPLYMLSLLCIIISLSKMFLLDKVHNLMSGGQIGMEAVVFCLGVLAVWTAKKAKNNDWLN